MDSAMHEVRSVATGGEPLEEPIRWRLERSFAADLSLIRIHADTTADRLARAFGTDGFAAGPHLFFRAGAYRPRSEVGLGLIAHEVTHALQQRSGSCGPGSELEAERAGRRAVAGQAVRLSVRPGALQDTPPRAIQRHESFEHRCLGDLPTGDISSLALGRSSTGFEAIVDRETALLWRWHEDPEQVTESELAASCPWVRTIVLPSTGLLVTYGELNSLPDYLTSVDAIDSCPRPVLLSILQAIRQESFVRLNALRHEVTKERFPHAPFGPDDWHSGLLDKVFHARALDGVTNDLGVNGIDHYGGLLARNACHFAPHSWYRWQTAYLTAADLARKAHAAGESRGGPLTVRAWTYHGYADHFLQDSFAAGHLINKTLVMQWFVKWAATTHLPVEDWALIKDMTPDLQPALAAPQLYEPGYTGPGTDPQTVEEQATYELRMALSGVTAYRDRDQNSVDQEAAYQRYLSFLSSVIAQAASNAVHDALNQRSLWVASPAHPDPYQVYGDDSLFSGANSAEGARITSEAAQLSQRSIQDLLETGETSVGVGQLRACFPSRAGDAPNTVEALHAWAFGQEQWVIDDVFDTAAFGAKRLAALLSPRLLNISQDQDP